MDRHKPSPKAINRISPELEKALKGNQLQTVMLKDGKGLCPGCSQEVMINDPAINARFTSLPVVCPSCKTEFRIIDGQDMEEEEEEEEGDADRYVEEDDKKRMADTLADVKLDDDGEEEQAGMVNIPENEVIAFFLDHPDPTDNAFHEYSESKGWDGDASKATAYKIATRYAQFRMGGRSKGVRPSDVVKEEEAKGQQVEYEHTANPDDALKIVWDHLAEAENSVYYTFLDLIEKALTAGDNHPLYKRLAELTLEYRDLPSGHE